MQFIVPDWLNNTVAIQYEVKTEASYPSVTQQLISKEQLTPSEIFGAALEESIEDIRKARESIRKKYPEAYKSVDNG